MEFEAVTLAKQQIIQPYLYRYGAGSCQHSFASMYCLADKYGDSFCEKDGWMLFYRAGISTPAERKYLMPMGDRTDREGLKRAIGAILEDAHSHHASACFQTLLEADKEAVLLLYPGMFEAEAKRGYFEYIYSYERLANLPGSDMASKRYDANLFYRTYGSRLRIERIEERHLDEIRAFQKVWLEQRIKEEEDVQLQLENTAILKGLAHYQQLNMSGIAVYIDDVLCGYAFGSPLNRQYYDVMYEKGDRSYQDIYKVLNRDLVRQCCQGFLYINREEDINVAGLRKAKLSYKPDFLLQKYCLREVRHE